MVDLIAVHVYTSIKASLDLVLFFIHLTCSNSPVNQLFLVWDCPSPGDIQQCLETFWLSLWRVVDTTGIQWVKTRDAADIVQCTGQSLTKPFGLAQNVNNAQAEKRCCKLMSILNYSVHFSLMALPYFTFLRVENARACTQERKLFCFSVLQKHVSAFLCSFLQ